MMRAIGLDKGCKQACKKASQLRIHRHTNSTKPTNIRPPNQGLITSEQKFMHHAGAQNGQELSTEHCHCKMHMLPLHDLWWQGQNRALKIQELARQTTRQDRDTTEKHTVSTAQWDSSAYDGMMQASITAHLQQLADLNLAVLALPLWLCLQHNLHTLMLQAS
jgi:hypothetical protein